MGLNRKSVRSATQQTVETPATAPSTRREPLHLHKLFPPPDRPNGVRREGIVNRVLSPGSAAVMVLQAPAGYGKSTALRQIKSAWDNQEQLSGWLTFDEADNDARRFTIHFEALLQRLSGTGTATLENAPQVSDDAYTRRTDWVVDHLAALGRPVALFFDDFQCLTDPSLLRLFSDIFERVPPGVRIFVGTRSVPELGLARLMVNGQATVLRAEELRFNASEVDTFFSGVEADPATADEVARIYQLSEGWPAALQLYRLSMRDPAVRQLLGDFSSRRPRELADYLADNVLALQLPGVQDFLLRTSLLSRLSAPLCNAVTGRSDAQDVLQLLERTGLFVRRLDLDGRWFEYHNLFGSFLAEQMMDRDAELATEVHRRAAEWLLQHGDLESTVRHALACGDVGLAADTLDEWCSSLVSSGMLITAERWCDRLPFDEIAARPSLMIKCAWALCFLRRWEKLQPLMTLLTAREKFHLAHADPSTVLSMIAIGRDEFLEAFRLVRGIPIEAHRKRGFEAFEVAAAANLTAYMELSYGRAEATRDALATARMQGERSEATFSSGYTSGVLGVDLLLNGHLPESVEHLRGALSELRFNVAHSHASGAIASCYIWSLYEANELDAAEAVFRQWHDTIEQSALLDFLASAQISMLRIHDVHGAPDRAQQVIDEAESIARANGWSRYLRMLRWERVRRALLLGDLSRAKAIAQAGSSGRRDDADAPLLFAENFEDESLGQIRLAIYTDQMTLARELLQRESGRSCVMRFREIKLALLEAQWHQRKRARNLAQRVLNKALQLAAPGRYIRCFLDEGEPVLSMLREMYQSIVTHNMDDILSHQGVDKSFIEELLRSSGTDLSRGPASTRTGLLEPLTDRETKILMLLANGVSNREMAVRLIVSENTIKFHLKRIYSKLAVASRLQAVASARDLGLIK